MNSRFYVCSSNTPRNNGLVKACDARLELEDGLAHNCPICSAEMTPEYVGPSVSDVLRRGLEKEKKKGMHR